MFKTCKPASAVICFQPSEASLDHLVLLAKSHLVFTAQPVDAPWLFLCAEPCWSFPFTFPFRLPRVTWWLLWFDESGVLSSQVPNVAIVTLGPLQGSQGPPCPVVKNHPTHYLQSGCQAGAGPPLLRGQRPLSTDNSSPQIAHRIVGRQNSCAHSCPFQNATGRTEWSTPLSHTPLGRGRSVCWRLSSRGRT